MGFKALITIDLGGASSSEREKFYERLKAKNWIKLPNLTTAWEASFQEGVSREEAMRALKAEINEAKNYSGIRKVDYAIQMGKGDLEVG